MLGDTHCFVANLALACLAMDDRHILFPRWGGIEAGATLSDHFRIMWESVEPGSKEKQLAHRCFVDSQDPKNHGCITRALDYSEGSVGFVQDYLDGKLTDDYTEDSFLENLGMFFGVISHHISDLCTPVHIGHKIDFKSLGYKSLAYFHKCVERDIYNRQNKIRIELHEPKIVTISQKFFWDIAKDNYENVFVCLENIYGDKNELALLEMASKTISSAVRHTSDIWHTILSNTGMDKKKWSMQPLL